LAKRPAKQVQPESGPEKAFGQALREVRKEQGFSQERLALEAHFDRTYVSLIERGVRSPTVRVVAKLAETLGVNPSEIMRRMETLLAEERKRRRKSKASGRTSR